jgi:4-hydroxy-2-oxoheptanedioate aldolase
MTLRNPSREKLAAGQPSLGVLLRQARTVDIAPALATAGMDWLFIDLEHGAMTLDTAVQISVAANGADITPFVRVPEGQYEMATRALDGGAMGIIMPHVDTPEAARTLAQRCRFAPRGTRSYGGPMAQLGFKGLPVPEATASVNDAILLVAMLETRAAIANAAAIAAVPGIDILLIGTNDLSLDFGLPGQLMHPDIVAAYKVAAKACAQHGKWLGMGGVYTPEAIAQYMQIGARFILTGSDLGFTMAGASTMAQRIAEAQLKV